MGNRYEIDEEFISICEEGAKLGLSIEQICQNLGIGRTTFYNYSRENPELNKRIRKARIKSVQMVAGKLYENALEGDIKAQKLFLQSRDPEAWNDRLIEHRALFKSINYSDESKKILGDPESTKEKRLETLIKEHVEGRIGLDILEKFSRIFQMEDSERIFKRFMPDEILKEYEKEK